MGSLTVHVLNNDGDPVCGEQVFVNFIESFLGIADTHLTDYTDSDDTAEFDDIPTVSAEIYVNSELQDTVSIGQNDAEDVTISI